MKTYKTMINYVGVGSKRKSKVILIFLTILFLPIISAQLVGCTDVNEIDIGDIPCEGITNVITCTGNVSVINLNTTEQTNVTTFNLGDGRRNFTFNFNESSYSLVDCANNSATVIVGVFEQGFGTSIFFFILPLFTISFIALLFSSKIGKRMIESEEESDLTENMIHKNTWIPTIIMIFSFLPILFVVRIVHAYLEEFLPASSLVVFFGQFYIFFSFLFYFIFLIFIINQIAEFRKVKQIRMGALDD